MDNEYEYISDTVSLDQGESTETLSELQSGTDSGDLVISPIDDNDNSVPDELEPSFENLLKEYLKSSLLNTETREGEESDGVSEEVEEETSEIDYTELLEDIINNQESLQSYSEYITGYLEDYDINNNLNADVNEISLTNALLLLLFCCFLFHAALDFARSIFL